jgi:PQQ-dependent dehydrogenase (methanol/ethanol family)
MYRLVRVAFCCGILALQGCAERASSPERPVATSFRHYAAVDDARLRAADANADQWMSHGRDYNEQRFSPLARINVDTVKTLGLAWYADFDTRRTQEATPIVVDGVLYATSAWSKVFAYDAKTGKSLWNYDPKVSGEWAVNACCDVVNRGVAAWNGKIYVGTLDGRLVALDGGTGNVMWNVQTTDRTQALTITGAPRIARGKVFIGQAGSEFEQRGYISAYDAETGKLDWRWYVVPGNPANGFENAQMELAAKTWGGEWWKIGGGGTPWDAITYDPATDLVYVGTGNGGPFPAEIRSPGNNVNLYVDSIVALRAQTGEYVWHYQMTPHDSWDYDGTQQLTVADLTLDGIRRHVVMQASKNGFFYIVDTANGKLLSAQPFIEDINWASGIDLATGAPRINPQARYDRTNQGFIVNPSPEGAHSWHPMSYSPQTGLVYIPAARRNFPMVAQREDDNPMGQKLSVSFAKGFALYNRPEVHRFNDGFLVAWDPVKQRAAWSVKFADGGRGGGTLATAGNLVFQGNVNEELAAYRADTGEKLWAAPTQTGIVAGASTFEVGGEQYVAVVAGSRSGGNYYSPNYSRVLVYKLGGTTQLPPKVAEPVRVLNPPEAFGTPERIKHGEETYNRFCRPCHGVQTENRGAFPDLKYSAALNSAELFKTIVLDGALAQNGMVSFAKAISAEDAEGVRAYVVSRAIEAQQKAALAPAAQPGAPH